MKQTTKNILGVGAIILLSSGVAGLTTYKLLQSNESAKETSFNEMFKQNPNVKLAAFDAVNAQPVDLTQAAENSLHAVVHIRSTQEAKTRTDLRNETIVTIDGDDAKDGVPNSRHPSNRHTNNWDTNCYNTTVKSIPS